MQRGDKPAQAGLHSVLTGSSKLLSDELNFQKCFRDLVGEKPEDAAAGAAMRLCAGPGGVPAGGAAGAGGARLDWWVVVRVPLREHFVQSAPSLILTACHFSELRRRNLGSHIPMNK